MRQRTDAQAWKIAHLKNRSLHNKHIREADICYIVETPKSRLQGLDLVYRVMADNAYRRYIRHLRNRTIIPNTETIAAMEAARRGDVIHVGSPADLLASLNA